jgi:protein TonB
MKIRGWIVISAALHLLVGAAYAISEGLKTKHYEDISFVQMAQSHPSKSKPPEEFSDEGLKKRKPVIETNKKPEPEPDNNTTGTADDSTNYMPYYLVEELPVSLTPIEPKYPEEARRQGVEGRVMMQVYIDTSGVVDKVEVLKSPSDVLAQSAMKAVYETRFRPARLKGEIKAVCMQLALRFRLE